MNPHQVSLQSFQYINLPRATHSTSTSGNDKQKDTSSSSNTAAKKPKTEKARLDEDDSSDQLLDLDSVDSYRALVKVGGEMVELCSMDCNVTF
jgi:hypothetical protein